MHGLIESCNNDIEKKFSLKICNSYELTEIVGIKLKRINSPFN